MLDHERDDVVPEVEARVAQQLRRRSGQRIGQPQRQPEHDRALGGLGIEETARQPLRPLLPISAIAGEQRERQIAAARMVYAEERQVAAGPWYRPVGLAAGGWDWPAGLAAGARAELRADGPVDDLGRQCFTFRVDNISLAPTLADTRDGGTGRGAGFNELYLSMAMVPGDDPTGRTQMRGYRTALPRFPVGGIKSPVDGVIRVEPQDLVDRCPPRGP